MYTLIFLEGFKIFKALFVFVCFVLVSFCWSFLLVGLLCLNVLVRLVAPLGFWLVHCQICLTHHQKYFVV